MPEVAFRLAPNGKRLGFCVGASSDGSAALIVLPKAWRPRKSRIVSVSWPTDNQFFLVGYEGDTVVVEATGDSADMLRKWLLEFQADDSELVELILNRRPFTATDADTPDTAVQPLLDLLELFDRARVELADELLPHTADRHELIRLVLYRKLIAELDPLISRLRPRYLETEEVLQAPRGRILDRSLALTIATRRPDVICRFDEHSRATDLAIVLLAALRMVARYRGTPRTASLFRPLQERASRLSRVLDGVPVVDRRVAFRKSAGIRLSRLEREFTGALLVARQVLRDDLPVPGGGLGAEFQTFRLSVPTEKLWEHVLFQALGTMPSIVELHGNFDNRPATDAVDVPAPWTREGVQSITERYPDFLAVVREGSKAVQWCVDAKYKDRPAFKPPSEDANQMFVYSHLARVAGRTVDKCALVYPTISDPRARVQLGRERARTLPLSLVEAPFPSPPDLRTQRAWDEFIARSARSLATSLQS